MPGENEMVIKFSGEYRTHGKLEQVPGILSRMSRDLNLRYGPVTLFDEDGNAVESEPQK